MIRLHIFEKSKEETAVIVIINRLKIVIVDKKIANKFVCYVRKILITNTMSRIR